MHTTLLRPLSFALGLLFLLLGGCALPPSARMQPPSDIAPSADVLDVANRSRATGLLVDESFDVGGYQVRKVRRGLASSSSFSVGALSGQSGKESFSFAFSGRQAWEGRCELRSKDRFLEFKAVTLEERRAQLNCSCRAAEQEVSLKLDDEWRPMQGELVLGLVHYALQQLHFAGNSGGVRESAVGYRVEQPGNGVGVAAVEVLHPGRIWQQHSLPAEQREPMACLLSALMIYGAQR